MVSFENFVKSMLPSLSELKVTPSFCFPFKIPDNPTATNIYDRRQTNGENNSTSFSSDFFQALSEIFQTEFVLWNQNLD